MRKRHPEHVNHERWLVSYADFITLLFAFFVIMFAISQADIAKFRQVSQSMKAAFSASGPAGVLDNHGTSGGATVNPFEAIEPPGGRALNLPAGKTNVAAEPAPDLQETRDLLEESVSLELGVSDMSEKMQTSFDSRGLVIRLAAKDFFDAGEAEVRPDLHPLLERIGRVLAKSRRPVRVEGHIDASEEGVGGRHGRYASGWELSAARAAWVIKYWVQRFDLDPKRFGAAGYSSFRPLTEKSDEWSRSKNRRVEIIILNNQYEAQ